ncbi:hypothetical protein ANTQUA_LOCUS6995 [Anthophora quadrimaculata]
MKRIKSQSERYLPCFSKLAKTQVKIRTCKKHTFLSAVFVLSSSLVSILLYVILDNCWKSLISLIHSIT